MLPDHITTVRVSMLFSTHREAGPVYVPKKSVEVSVPHVFEHHGQRLSVGADAVESHDVLVLEHRQQLRLPLEVLPRRLVGILESL